MDSLRTVVRRHPVTSFFTLAFGVSWLLWMPYILSSHGLGLESGIQIPKVLGTAQFAGVLPGAYLGPLGAALIVTAITEGRPGLRRWAHRLTHWRVGWRWFFAVLLSVPAVIVLAPLALAKTWGNLSVPSATILLMYLPMLLVQFITTAAAEEPGWRDFALPRMQERYGPLLGTSLLGLLWGCWHLPLFLTEWGGPSVTWLHPVEFIAGCIPLSLVMTWVFNRSGQSVPLIMLLHAGVNSTYTLVWPQVYRNLDHSSDALHAQLVASLVVAAVVVVATRGRLGLRSGQAPTDRTPAQHAPQHSYVN